MRILENFSFNWIMFLKASHSHWIKIILASRKVEKLSIRGPSNKNSFFDFILPGWKKGKILTFMTSFHSANFYLFKYQSKINYVTKKSKYDIL